VDWRKMKVGDERETGIKIPGQTELSGQAAGTKAVGICL